MLRPQSRPTPMNTPFRGDYEHTLDAKNRLTVPSRFRSILGGNDIVLARGIEACVTAWRPEEFDSWTRRMIEALGGLTPKARDFRRMVSASAFETELDSAGRVMIPTKLIEYAGIDREVSVVGEFENFEVWDRSAWQTWDDAKKGEIRDIVDTIGSDG